MESTVLVKAFAILEATASAPDGAALGQLAFQVGINKPTTHRILQALSTLGYVERSGFGKYRATSQTHRLVPGADDQRLVDVAGPHLQRLYAKTRETINLGVLRSNRIAYLHVLESTHALRRVAEPNSFDHVHCTALGRAILAFLPESQREMLIRGPLEAMTPRTITDPRELRKELRRVATQGYSVEKDQTDLGVTCVGAPILVNGRPIAAVSASIPSARADSTVEGALKKLVQRTAKSIAKNPVFQDVHQ